MKLHEYIEQLQEFVADNPECDDMEVVFSKDEEGNGFNVVSYSPSKGVFNRNDKDFIESGNLEGYGFDDSDINSVCIN
jgi:uncharacterized protein YkuJ|tara:strand:- start:41 stop:274 length:234 start_codon:yes stop_codon:yes gene_type:complete